MTTRLGDVGQDLFDQLTARTFFVVDTEFCTHQGEHHLISLAIVPVVGGRRTKVRDEFHAIMNPGVPIDSISSAIHGFTDADVARKRPFRHYARVILARLNEPDAVFVCHNTIDIHVLRQELERLDELAAGGDTTITTGLADLPVMPIIDTQRLAHAASYPGAPRSTRLSLDALCDLTGVPRTGKAHDAREDARATANALIEVVKYSAEHSVFWTFDALQEAASGGSTIDPKGPAHIKSRDRAPVNLPAEHVAKHIYPLTDPVEDGSDAAERWLDMAVECAQLRCPYLRDEAAVAAAANGAVLLRPLMDDLPHLTEPGQAGTLLGAVYEFLTVETAATTTLPPRRALKWWALAKPDIQASAPCNRDGRTRLCPSCIEGDPCPRDILYVAVAEIATLGTAQTLTSTRIRDLLSTSLKAPINTWRKHHRDVLAYALWRVAQHAASQGIDDIATNAVTTAMAMDLHRDEPRLAQLACQQLVDDGDPNAAFAIGQEALDQRTTDTAFEELSDWMLYTRATLYGQQPTARRPITHKRLARPEGHTNPRLYS